ncbi:MULTISPECIES: zinc-binding dehydrogenase [unclassified Streptomyces]|uniref:zinc-binding dehydrogenase n=1 Tax=unclassified Streptomyces TaxID=2593676 RepID=UPI000DBA999A|nr:MULTISPECIES: zinc-binding dehydrogenase [unclassified Streptomyces]MYT73367.1 zinc-binding dehydrogenase [Streptomyces sp. SID8367]RAJ70585.1 NADPH:quinone reductase-like Zn-dependent oxidoreductase [Streptomyces sp. PsTaAH-137]
MKAMVSSPANDSAEPVVLGEVPEPEPAPDEALIAVEAYCVNRGETLQLDGGLDRRRPGWRPGKDVAGTVLGAAADGTGPAAGTRVVAHPPAHGWAERVAVSTANLAELPYSVDAVTAAALPLAGITALRLLRTAGPLAGRRVLLTGASGGVGHYITELAAACGAHLTAVSGTAERGARLLQLGAAELITSVDDAKGPFDVVLESVGGVSLPSALAQLAPGGLLVWFGQASRQPVTLNFFDFFKGPNQARLAHFDYTASDPTYGKDLAALVRLVAGGRLHPEIGTVRDWSHTPGVIDDLRGRKIRGNAVLTVS